MVFGASESVDGVVEGGKEEGLAGKEETGDKEKTRAELIGGGGGCGGRGMYRHRDRRLCSYGLETLFGTRLGGCEL